jgi:hypothetical protein
MFFYMLFGRKILSVRGKCSKSMPTKFSNRFLFVRGGWSGRGVTDLLSCCPQLIGKVSIRNHDHSLIFFIIHLFSNWGRSRLPCLMVKELGEFFVSISFLRRKKTLLSGGRWGSGRILFFLALCVFLGC